MCVCVYTHTHTHTHTRTHPHPPTHTLQVGLPDTFSAVLCDALDHTPWDLLRAEEEYPSMGVTTAETLRETALWTLAAFGALGFLGCPCFIGLVFARRKARLLGERRALLRK